MITANIIPFPLASRLSAANDDGPDGPPGNAVTPASIMRPSLRAYAWSMRARRAAA